MNNIKYKVLCRMDNKFQQKYNSYKFNMITKQHPPLSKTRLSPLFLLSKVKKNNQLSNQRQSVLAIIEREQTKINNRYGQIVNRFSAKTEGNQAYNKEKQLDQSLQNEETNTTSNKISQILKKSFNRGRFHSVDRRKNRNTSPYLSQQRKNLKTDLNKDTSLSKSTTNVETAIKKSKQKIFDGKNQLQIQLQKRKVSKDAGDKRKIFIHFDNFYRIDQIVEKKRIDKQIIVCIKKYVLQEQGDSSEIEHLYSDEKIRLQVKRILFLQKLLVIVIVDLIINRKMKLAQMFIKLAIKTVIKFYQSVFSDLKTENLIEESIISLISPEALSILSAEDQQQPNVTFNYIMQCLQAKLKTFFKYCRQIEKFYKKHQKNILDLSTNMSYFKLLQFYSQNLLGTNWATWNIDFLEVCPSPYLHHDPHKKYTLVLDLDETLIHYKVGNSTNNYQGQFLIRPYMFEFLQQMSEYYQLGIFTCSLPEYADLIINHMKPIQFRLYRHHTIKLQGQYVKDLSRLGRDLKNLILVDNLEQNFKLQRLNGIHIRSWYGDRNDDMLKKLAVELKRLALSNAQDFRLAEFQRKFL